MITFIDLFAGIGGFHIALNNLGAQCVFASEIDTHARKTYELNFKNHTNGVYKDNANNNHSSLDFPFNKDITTVNPDDIPDFDILCAGFPCQSFSQAGKQKGFSDIRGTLFFNIASILEKKSPPAFILENVRNLLKHDNGQTFQIIKTHLEKLGYKIFYKIIKATDFNCPQHRPRIYIVGFKDNTIDFNFPDSIELTTTMSHLFKGKCTRDIGYTVRVGGRGSPINDRHNWDGYIVDDKEVRLTPDIAKLMQGYPQSYQFNVSKLQAMKQIGNSVAIPVVQAIAKEVLKFL